MSKKITNGRTKLIIKDLDSIIDTAISKSQQLTLARETTFKLLPATAIAFLVTYLVFFTQYTGNVSINLAVSVIYCFSMLVFPIYICVKKKNKVIRHIYAMTTILGFTWLLLHLGKVSVAIDSTKGFLYVAASFVSTFAIISSLINSVYPTPRYSNRFLFDDYRYLAIGKLTKFGVREINIAIFYVKAIAKKLERKIKFYLFTNLILTLSLWYLHVFLFNSAISNWWFHPLIIYGIILSFLLSATVIFIAIESINCNKKIERYHLYTLILLEYDIARLKFNTLLLRTKLE